MIRGIPDFWWDTIISELTTIVTWMILIMGSDIGSCDVPAVFCPVACFLPHSHIHIGKGRTSL